MLKFIRELVKDEKDERLAKATEQAVGYFNDESLDVFWEDEKKCNFDHHVQGRGANHIWFARRGECYRVGMIIEEA